MADKQRVLVIAATHDRAREYISRLPDDKDYYPAVVCDRFPGRRFNDVLLVFGWDVGYDIGIVRQWLREQVLTRAMTADASRLIRSKVPWQD